MGEPIDPYVVLGLRVGATQGEIARAYRSRVRRYHPDTRSSEASSAGSRTIADNALAQVMDAYETLMQPAVGPHSELAGDKPSPPPQKSQSDQAPFDRSQSREVPVHHHPPRLLPQGTIPIKISPLRWEPSS